MNKITAPIIIESETSNLNPSSQKSGFGIRNPFKRMPKALLIVVIVAILAEAFFAFKVFSSPSPKIIRDESIQQAIMMLSSTKEAVKVGEEIPVTLWIATNNQKIVAADAIIEFDPNTLELASPVQLGSIFEEYPLNRVNRLKGVIEVSGISSVAKEGFSGTGDFAYLTFRAKTKANTSIRLSFTKGASTDSNMINSANKDILEFVSNLHVIIE